MARVTIASASHPGKRKKTNEDYCAFFPPEDGLVHQKGILMALADGMGGRVGGKLASRLAVDVLMQAYYRDSFDSIPDALQAAFNEANQVVIAKGKTDAELEGMATTLTAVVLKDDKMYHAHVGDSRAYSIYGNSISHFTQDHSYVASLVKAGAIRQEEALTHPQANLLTRAIGIDTVLKIDLSKDYHHLRTNEYVLLCCDGLYKEVSDREILEVVQTSGNPDTACGKLVEKANENGGDDNITVMIARIDKISLTSSMINRFMSL